MSTLPWKGHIWNITFSSGLPISKKTDLLSKSPAEDHNDNKGPGASPIRGTVEKLNINRRYDFF